MAGRLFTAGQSSLVSYSTRTKMIKAIVDFALNKRLLVVALAVLLFGWGMVSFHRLPVEAYPDVADNYVEVITQWPGISAEQIEQQVTIPLETAMNGIPGIVHLRSFSLFGLSDLKLIFSDDTENAWNRRESSSASPKPPCHRESRLRWAPIGARSAKSTFSLCTTATLDST